MVKVIQKGNKILRQVAKAVPLEDIGSEKIKDVLKDMEQSLFECKEGIALAAPQIGIPLRIFIIDKNVLDARGEPTPDKSAPPKKVLPIVFINPVIKKISRTKNLLGEGCLSITGVYGTIKRASKLTVEACDEHGKKFTRGASGLLAQIIQHEVDHLDGVLFIDKATHIEKVK